MLQTTNIPMLSQAFGSMEYRLDRSRARNMALEMHSVAFGLDTAQTLWIRITRLSLGLHAILMVLPMEQQPWNALSQGKRWPFFFFFF